MMRCKRRPLRKKEFQSMLIEVKVEAKATRRRGAIRTPRRKVQKILESKMAESSLHVEVEEYR